MAFSPAEPLASSAAARVSALARPRCLQSRPYTVRAGARVRRDQVERPRLRRLLCCSARRKRDRVLTAAEFGLCFFLFLSFLVPCYKPLIQCYLPGDAVQFAALSHPCVHPPSKPHGELAEVRAAPASTHGLSFLIYQKDEKRIEPWLVILSD